MRHKRFKGEKSKGRLAFLILAAIVITCFAYPYFYSALLKREFNPGSLIRVSDYKGDGGTGEGFAVFSGKLVCLRGTTLKLQAGDGSTLWERHIDIKKPYIAGLEEIIAIADVDKGVIYGIDGQGQNLWQVTPSNGIIRMGADSHHIWVISRHQQRTVAEVFNQRGMETSYLQIDGAEVTDVSVSRDGALIAVSTADIKDGSITGSVILYNSESSILWAKSYRDSLVLGIRFTDEGSLLVLTEKALMGLSEGGDVLWRSEVEGYITRALLTDKGAAAITVSDDYRSGVPGGGSDETVLYGREGIQMGRFRHGERVTRLVEGQDCIGIFSGRRLKTVPLGGKGMPDKVFDRDLAAIYLLENNYVAYISTGKLYFEPVAR
ncbi:MAG: hypothetical protein GX114_03935 [Clostridiales bacterium]|nr:hypothetical protein [Clostridiales bacterium]